MYLEMGVAMKLVRWLVLFVVLVLPFGPTTLAAPGTAAPTNTCAVGWQAVTVPNVGNLRAVQAISPTDVWAGGEGDFIHWNGAAWTQSARPANAPVTRMSASGPNDVWALAGGGGSLTTNLFHWNGTAWSDATLPPATYLYDVYAVAPDNVWLAAGGQMYHWNGTVWEDKSPEIGVDVFLYSVTVAGGVVYAGGRAGYTPTVPPTGILKYDGANWTLDYSYSMGQIEHLGSAANTVIGIGPVIPSNDAFVYRNGGWDRSALSNPYNDVSVLAADDAYVVGQDILHWNGTEWVFNAKATAMLNGVSADSASDAWAVGDGALVLHGTTPPCAPEGCAQAPILLTPGYEDTSQKRVVRLDWASRDCATSYKYLLRQDKEKGPRIARGTVKNTHVKTPKLLRGHAYYWRVRACNSVSCGVWSFYSKFVVQD